MGDQEDMRDVFFSVGSMCPQCRHLIDPSGGRCAAFPEGIPDEITDGTIQHTERIPGDHGITFEADGNGKK